MKKNKSIATANEWWNNTTNEIKSLFSGVNNETANGIFWKKLNETDRNNIYRYWQYKTGKIDIQVDDANSLLREIICELADVVMENEHNVSRENMCGNDGSFLEKYQDEFNSLYDDIEDRLLNYDFTTK